MADVVASKEHRKARFGQRRQAIAEPVTIPAKMRPFLLRARYKFARGGRGGAKSHTIARLLLLRGWEKPIRWLCAREVQKSIRDSSWRLLGDTITVLGLEGFYRVTDTEIRGANGTLFIFQGLSNETADTIKSLEGMDGVWIEEAHSITQRSLDILIPTIRKEGSEIWFSYNPDLETDPVHLMAEKAVETQAADSVVVDINLLDNPWAPRVLIEERRKAYLEDPVKAAWIWGGKCRPVAEGAIYEREIVEIERSGRIANVPYEPAADCMAVFDLGIGDHTSIVLRQDVQNEIHIVEAYENQGVDSSHYIDWLKRCGCRIDEIVLPHDGAARSKDTGRTMKQVYEAAFPGIPVTVLPRTTVEVRIDNARNLFKRLWIDRTRCKLLIHALRKYRRRFDDDSGRFEEPLHDGYSDMADAFGYSLEAKPSVRRAPIKIPTQTAPPGW